MAAPSRRGRSSMNFCLMRLCEAREYTQALVGAHLIFSREMGRGGVVPRPLRSAGAAYSLGGALFRWPREAGALLFVPASLRVVISDG
jgi:hypothetical protein